LIRNSDGDISKCIQRLLEDLTGDSDRGEQRNTKRRAKAKIATLCTA
jgi:hypothetical protein